MHLFRLLVLALIPQHQHQVVHVYQCGWLLSTCCLTFSGNEMPESRTHLTIDPGYEENHLRQPQNRDSRHQWSLTLYLCLKQQQSWPLNVEQVAFQIASRRRNNVNQ
jgi:hypothetical protein